MYEDLDILDINIRFTVRLPKIYLGSMCITILSPNIAYRHSANTGGLSRDLRRGEGEEKSPKQT
jgi:hypothetical protein